MVGVPGKSKGCHTCRRRKIGCDLAKPDCLRCTKTGRVCEGYKRGAVFLNRTAQGLDKRAPLEEAQPRNVPKQDKLVAASGHRSSPPLVQMDTVVVTMKQMEGLFLNDYLPSDPTALEESPGIWLYQAAMVDEPGPALTYALRALFVTRTGRAYAAEALVVRGRAAYGSALSALQRALSTQHQADRDDTLAACNVLALYELFESTLNCVTAQNNHMTGFVRMIRNGAPDQPLSPLKRSMVLGMKYSAVVQSILHRRITRFDYRKDEHTNWNDAGDIQEKLYHLGFDVAALLHRIDDRLASSTTPEERSCALRDLICSCMMLDTDLVAWYRELMDAYSHTPLYWISTDASRSNLSGEPFIWTPEERPTLEFPTLLVGQLLALFWGLRLCLGTQIDFLHRQFSHINQSPPLYWTAPDSTPPPASLSAHDIQFSDAEIYSDLSLSFSLSLSCDDPNLFMASDLVHPPDLPTAASYTSPPPGFNLSLDPNLSSHVISAGHSPNLFQTTILIMLSIPSMLSPSAGLSSAQKCLFPLRIAIFRLQMYPGAQLECCLSLFRDLERNKGFKFATDIEELPPQWQVVEEDLRESIKI